RQICCLLSDLCWKRKGRQGFPVPRLHFDLKPGLRRAAEITWIAPPGHPKIPEDIRPWFDLNRRMTAQRVKQPCAARARVRQQDGNARRQCIRCDGGGCW